MSAYWIGFWNGVAWAAIISVTAWLLITAWIVVRKFGEKED